VTITRGFSEDYGRDVLRVIVAEDSMLVREGILTVLAQYLDVEVIATCETLPQLLEAVAADPPDVVLTDIRMPPTTTDEGVRAAALLREQHPSVGVVVLSQYAEPAYAIELLAEGSRGRAYLLKERVGGSDELVDAIRQVAAGGSVVDPMVVDLLVKARVNSPSSPLERLSPRELEVLGELAQGKNNTAVAKALVLTVRAVEKHINSVFSKLGLAEEDDVHRRVKAVLMYLSDRSTPSTAD
jgi:DNA-binding NarL/FixJ family response regulator